jgi:1,4-alpha-glucan branching enzyme
VELVGDFTMWKPMEMDQTSGTWTLELEVPDGLYHFGFLVDGEWFVPVDAIGTVPDEWGRQNATLVVDRQAVGEGGGAER